MVHGKPEQNEDNAAISALDLNSYHWKTLNPEGISPKYPFTGMSSWVYKGRIYIFGGNHDKFTEEERRRYPSWMKVDRWNLSNQLFFYDISTDKWAWPASVTGDLPLPRCDHHTIISGATIFLFGGWALPSYPTDLCMLDMKEMRWSKVDTLSPSTDDWPCGRHKFTFTLISPNQAVVYGGMKESSGDPMLDLLGDCWLLDFERTKEGDHPWTRCRHHEKDIRLQHSAVLEPESRRLWLMGGYSNECLYPTGILMLSFNSFAPLKICAMEWVVNQIPPNDPRLAAIPTDLRREYKLRRFYKKLCYNLPSAGSCANGLCGRENATMKKCSRCKIAYFCSKECQGCYSVQGDKSTRGHRLC